MYEYVNFIIELIASFGIVYVLFYLSTILRDRVWIRQNLVFVIAFILAFNLGRTEFKTSFLIPLSFLWLVVNLYLLLPDKIKSHKILSLLTDFVIFSGTLFLSQLIFAIVDNIPVKKIITQRFENGSFSFIPGHLDYMLQFAINFSFAMVFLKKAFLFLVEMWKESKNSKIRSLETEKKNIESQFESLQSKVNPHFLYNSLNSIAGLATVDGEKTRQMALALSRFFRYNMNREQEVMVSLEEEAEMISTYLEIEKIRFGDKLNYQINLPSGVGQFSLPRMLLQPIVENAVKHGLKGDCESLNIVISFTPSEKGLTISIKDNGAPFPDDFMPGYGIRSVYEKLDLLYPDNYKVEWLTSPEKVVTIWLNRLISLGVLSR